MERPISISVAGADGDPHAATDRSPTRGQRRRGGRALRYERRCRLRARRCSRTPRPPARPRSASWPANSKTASIEFGLQQRQGPTPPGATDNSPASGSSPPPPPSGAGSAARRWNLTASERCASWPAELENGKHRVRPPAASNATTLGVTDNSPACASSPPPPVSTAGSPALHSRSQPPRAALRFSAVSAGHASHVCAAHRRHDHLLGQQRARAVGRAILSIQRRQLRVITTHAGCGPTAPLPAGASTRTGRRRCRPESSALSLPASNTPAGCGPTSPLSAGAATGLPSGVTWGGSTRPRGGSSPSRPAPTIHADCGPTAPSPAGATTFPR